MPFEAGTARFVKYVVDMPGWQEFPKGAEADEVGCRQPTGGSMTQQASTGPLAQDREGRPRHLPRRVLLVMAAYVICFLWGTTIHLVDLAGGGHNSYASPAPAPIRVYFVALVLLDPLVVVLVARLRPIAVIVAGAVMTVDVSANYYVNWPQISQHPDYLLRPLGLLPITLFALFVAVTASPLYRHLARTAEARKLMSDNVG
ncbi:MULTISPECIES: hypothetical protein [unclassified Streptomyces]|uniref:hypothetical protein n=1 Tax=unclassified Streptomyces TaxID=2593676 RepID=UPI0035DEF1E8